MSTSNWSGYNPPYWFIYSSVDVLQYWPNIGLPIIPDKCIQFFLNLNGTLNFQKDKIDYY